MTVERRAARVLLVADDSVLLLQGHDPSRAGAGDWWITPGGGLEPGESLETAACREVLEETGLTLAPDRLGTVVATRTAVFAFEGREYRQSESFFAVAVDRFEPRRDRWEAVERRALTALRWWTLDELETTTETVYPRELAHVLRTVRAGRPRDVLVLSGE